MPRKFHVELTSTAQEDLSRVFDYIAEDSPASARRWVDELEGHIATLERFSLRCAVIPEAEDVGRQYRHLIIGSYRVIFRIAGSTVFVLRRIHGAQLLDMSVLES